MPSYTSTLAVAAAVWLAAALPHVDAFVGLCTYHNYEGDMATFGPTAYDNSPGWCGYRYSSMDLSRVMAMNSIQAATCNSCWAVRSATDASSPTRYILAIDQKGAEGLDIAKSSFEAIFPNANPADPQTCNWEQVDVSNCFDVCRGSDLECTLGLRNSLPMSMLGSAAGIGNLRYSDGSLAHGGSSAPAAATPAATSSTAPAATSTSAAVPPPAVVTTEAPAAATTSSAPAAPAAPASTGASAATTTEPAAATTVAPTSAASQPAAATADAQAPATTAAAAAAITDGAATVGSTPSAVAAAATVATTTASSAASASTHGTDVTALVAATSHGTTSAATDDTTSAATDDTTNAASTDGPVEATPAVGSLSPNFTASGATRGTANRAVAALTTVAGLCVAFL